MRAKSMQAAGRRVNRTRIYQRSASFQAAGRCAVFLSVLRTASIYKKRYCDDQRRERRGKLICRGRLSAFHIASSISRC